MCLCPETEGRHLVSVHVRKINWELLAVQLNSRKKPTNLEISLKKKGQHCEKNKNTKINNTTISIIGSSNISIPKVSVTTLSQPSEIK